MADATMTMLRASVESLGRGKLPEPAVLKFLLSKGLGYGILTASSVIKVPQILALLKSKSAEGLAGLSFELENICFTIHASYGLLMGLPINSYGKACSFPQAQNGEAALMLAQNTVLLALMYKYARTGWARILGMAALNSSMIYAVLSGRVDKLQAQSMYDMNNLIVTAARVPQIMKNYKAESTGQLSAVAFVANVLGCMARIFTSYQDGAGMAMIRGFVLGFFLNATIMFQILYYNRRSKSAKQADKLE